MVRTVVVERGTAFFVQVFVSCFSQHAHHHHDCIMCAGTHTVTHTIRFYCTVRYTYVYTYRSNQVVVFPCLLHTGPCSRMVRSATG